MTPKNQPRSLPASVSDVIQTLRRHPLRWLGPAAVVTLLSAGYAAFRSPTWEASQALVVRDEATSKPERSGRFQNPEDMKTVQETIQELTRSRTVLTAALALADQAGDPTVIPTEQAVAALQGAVKITPPKGLEFGKSEVFYLKVQGASRDRAVALANAVCEQVQARFQELRNSKAQSLVDEMLKTVELAQADLNVATARLADLERVAGNDLAELRMLNESPSGDSDLRRSATEIESELRQARAAQHAEKELLRLLVDAGEPSSEMLNDTTKLLALPNKLLELQPALRRLKEGLLEAQLRTSQLAGSMSDQHPAVIAARESEAEVARQLRGEITTAIIGLTVDLRLTAEHVQSLEQQRADARTRMTKLAYSRADYGNAVTEVRDRSEILKTAQQALAEARASQAASHVASMITRVDAPDAGNGPAGPSRAQVIVLGGFAGLILGLGIVFLTTSGAIMTDIATEELEHGWAMTASPQEAFVTENGLSLKQDFVDRRGRN